MEIDSFGWLTKNFIFSLLSESRARVKSLLWWGSIPSRLLLAITPYFWLIFAFLTGIITVAID
jgi:hypothetical protein